MALESLFHLVCGSDHLWAPGGQSLPFCQRCTGLYLGALLTFLVYLWARPHPTARTLWMHAGFLLLMLPFGYHWVPQNGVVRTTTGFLFGCGLVYFLSLSASEHVGIWTRRHRSSSGRAAVCLAVLLVLLLLVARWGGASAATMLSWMGLFGLLLLVLLVVASLVLVPWSLVRPSR